MIRFLAFLVALQIAPFATAQSVNLAEKVATGDAARWAIQLDLKGELIFDVDGKKETTRLEAKARHLFTHRVLSVNEGMAGSTARLYTEAVASAVIASERMDRTLPANRTLIVAQRNPDGLFCFAPAGPLTRDELDLVTEHFNPQCLAGLLPNKAVEVGESWLLSSAAVHTACLFDAVIKADVRGKLTAIKDGLATFTIEGTAEGVENGGRVTVAVTATGTFDVNAGRVVALNWKQTDDREQGPVSPASRVEATIAVRRDKATELPNELADAAIAKLPQGDIPATMTDLRYTDPKERYTLTHSRDWHLTGRTDSHLVLRLLDGGQFAAQATVGVWKPVEPGKHSPPDEFKKAASEAPGWVPTKVLADGELSTSPGHWLYCLVVEGKMDTLQVVQKFYLLAGPQGKQVVVTVAMKPDWVKPVGDRDLALVKTIDFGKK